MSKSVLIIFQKNEILGKVKTRLAASIGNEKALEVYQLLVQHTYSILNQMEAKILVFYSDYIPDTKPNFDFDYRVQLGSNLGERMKNAFATVFNEGYDQAAIIGTDCAEVTADHLRQAFSRLKQFDTVIGPALDGGYYLLGMNSLIPELFSDISWSSDQVLQETILKLKLLNRSVTLLESLSDVDQIEDWEKLNWKLPTESKSAN
jgi:hypothetical protein